MADEVASEVGEAFNIELSEPATSGYRWSIDKLPQAISLVNETRQASGGGQSGNPLRHTFRLKASRPGHFQISFQLKRSWEQQSVEVKTMKVSVRA